MVLVQLATACGSMWKNSNQSILISLYKAQVQLDQGPPHKNTSLFVSHWQILSGGSFIRLLSASTCWHPQKSLGLVTVYGMDPQVGQSLDRLSFSLCSTLCLCISSHRYFLPPLKKDQSIHTLVFLLLRLHMVCELNLRYSELLD